MTTQEQYNIFQADFEMIQPQDVVLYEKNEIIWEKDFNKLCESYRVSVGRVTLLERLAIRIEKQIPDYVGNEPLKSIDEANLVSWRFNFKEEFIQFVFFMGDDKCKESMKWINEFDRWTKDELETKIVEAGELVKEEESKCTYRSAHTGIPDYKLANCKSADDYKEMMSKECCFPLPVLKASFRINRYNDMQVIEWQHYLWMHIFYSHYPFYRLCIDIANKDGGVYDARLAALYYEIHQSIRIHKQNQSMLLSRIEHECELFGKPNPFVMTPADCSAGVKSVHDELKNGKRKATNRTFKEFYIVYKEDGLSEDEAKEKYLKELHRLIDGKGGAVVGAVLLRGWLDGHLNPKPNKQKIVLSEFVITGSWSAVNNYIDKEKNAALLKAADVVFFP